jgi:hypothetical protein
MSEETTLADEHRAPRPAGIFEHYCEHAGCGKWGGWGFTRAKQQTEWFCYGHAPRGRV